MKSLYCILLFTFFLLTGAPTWAAELNQPQGDQQWQNVANEICDVLNQALTQYQQGNKDTARSQVNLAYFQLYDVKIEPAVRTNIGAARVFEIEQEFRRLGKAMGHTRSASQRQAKKITASLCEKIHKDASILNENHVKPDVFTALTANNDESNFFSTFLQAFIILLREGFEALLVIAALITYLYRTSAKEKLPIIYSGVGIGILASALTAYLFVAAFKVVNLGREAMEGIIMLIAAAIMIYVSYWLFAQGTRRKEALHKKLHSTLQTKNSFYTLGLLAFLAIYREGAETILFYQALLISGQGPLTALILGFITACIALAALYWLMRKATIKIPFRLFFSFTAIFLYCMAFTFIGSGIAELQNAQWLPITLLPHFPSITILSIYPTAESLGAQLLFLLPTAIGLWWWYKKQRTLKVKT